jgi:mannosyltransferase OCH1-like enzyme
MEFLIDKWILSKYNNITKIIPVSLYKNDVNNLIKFTTGNRKADNDILQKLAMGKLEYEDIINFYGSNNLYYTLILHNIRFL